MHDPRLIPLKTMTSDILKVSRVMAGTGGCWGGLAEQPRGGALL